MTRGAGTCWQQADDDGVRIWLEPPRDTQKPFTDSERAQRWRLSLASLLFLTVLLSDRLWFRAEATLLARTRDRLLLLPPPQPSLRGTPQHIFLGNSSGTWWRMDACHRDRVSADCLALADADADRLCAGLASSSPAERGGNVSDLYLSFCNSYSLLDLFRGAASPDNLNCSLDVLLGGDAGRCSLCVQAYQRYDQHAQEKYEDFEALAQKYEPAAFSVRTCMERCKTAYKPWLCSQYFPATAQRSCQRKVPCHQYCLEVQQSCPFILPDNDDLIHGGSPSFICTGLLGDEPSSGEAQCCDVRWDSRVDGPSGGTLKRTVSPCAPGGASGASVTSAATPRLCGGRLKICLLALVLLHTVIVISAAHNSTAAIFSPEEGAASEE
ncbi:transmembrane protein FAM155A-like [Salarias fasciatus]|uniref:Transmembrane protein FAM155A-like n=1 Tax=Salarias fasciatus TaxID=181472 RepID=A0A672IM34_SALFA|nr:transmembrane protein FAM155A-like [Salarias fasciatus]